MCQNTCTANKYQQQKSRTFKGPILAVQRYAKQGLTELYEISQKYENINRVRNRELKLLETIKTLENEGLPSDINTSYLKAKNYILSYML